MATTDIDYINAHGTSTPLGDVAECTGVKRAFGEHAYKLAVSSTKSMTGHLLGAAGGIEAVFTVLAMRDQIAPPTANLVNVDPKCDLDFVPGTARKMRIRGACPTPSASAAPMRHWCSARSTDRSLAQCP